MNEESYDILLKNRLSNHATCQEYVQNIKVNSDTESWTFFYAEETCVAIKRNDNMYFRAPNKLPYQYSNDMYFYRNIGEHIERIKLHAPANEWLGGQISKSTLSNYVDDWTLVCSFRET